jgi:hypothetical protein
MIADGIIITISAGMLKKNGYRIWLRNFLWCMEQDDCTYWMRQGAKPTREILYVYLCIGGRVRYRVNFVGTEGPCYKSFCEELMFVRAWVLLAGPVVRADRIITMKGFRGFRYTEKLF